MRVWHFGALAGPTELAASVSPYNVRSWHFADTRQPTISVCFEGGRADVPSDRYPGTLWYAVLRIISLLPVRRSLLPVRRSLLPASREFPRMSLISRVFLT